MVPLHPYTYYYEDEVNMQTVVFRGGIDFLEIERIFGDKK